MAKVELTLTEADFLSPPGFSLVTELRETEELALTVRERDKGLVAFGRGLYRYRAFVLVVASRNIVE